MYVVCLDVEGVLIPEIWINVAEKTDIPELKRTTRDEPDYAKLMRNRLDLLEKHNLTIHDIQGVIATMKPLPGANEFLTTLRERTQVFLLSDTFNEFAKPLMKQLGWPTILCHSLVIDGDGRVTDYALRQPDPKRSAVKAIKSMRYEVVAAGDSYNDTTMLAEANAGILFNAPENVIAEFPQFAVTRTYDELLGEIEKFIEHE